MKIETHLNSRLRRMTQWSLLIAVVISALSFIGWALGSTFITGLSPHYVPIAPSTALCFFILSASFLAYVLHPENPKRRTVAMLCASFAILICSIIMIAFFKGITIEAEHLGFYPTAAFTRFPVGHMSPITATNFIAASLGVLCLIFSPKGGQCYKNTAAFLALAAIATAFIVILGYLYGTPLLYGGNIRPVAFPTAAAFAFLGLGLLTASGPHVLPVRVFTGPSVRSCLLRAFLPTIIAFVLIYGWAYKTVLPTTSNPALISSLITILSAAFIGILISKMAQSIGAEIDLAHVERDKQAEALRESEENFRSLAEQSIAGIAIIQDKVLKYVNPKFADMFGYSVAECLDNMSSYKVLFPDDRKIVTEQMRKRMAGESPSTIYEVRGVTKNGKIIDIEIYGTPILYNKKPAAVGAILDISHRKFMERELKALSITDALTGLYNRRGFIALSEQQFKQTERKKDGLTLVFADLDHLKEINDSLGHTVGDEALVEVAEVFKEVFRKMDIIGRVGGDEFAILAPETSLEYSDIINNRLQDQLDIHNAREGRNYTISISVGMAYCDPEKPCSLDELMSRADSLMYGKKKAKHL
ncbi:MAG TPA: sensor domain-containing diguanylate cyclase [Syntrophales bacterium]|nr:sensor domain-containing diguanylate cyclase [Syntrophales bacterium]